MANCRIPNVLVYVREKGGKRRFDPTPENPDLTACYWLRYEKGGKHTWQRVGHYDSVRREKLLLERRLSAAAQGFIIPEDVTPLQGSSPRITIQAAVDACVESLLIRKRPTKTIGDKKRDIGSFTAFCKKTYTDEIVSRDMLGFRDHQRAEDYS
jgi:hypothetical protein